MIFLRALFWLVFAVAVAAFSAHNWQRVTLRLWGDILVDINLPVLLLIVFLAGLLPGVVLHRTARWRMRRELQATARLPADVYTAPAATDPDPLTTAAP